MKMITFFHSARYERAFMQVEKYFKTSRFGLQPHSKRTGLIICCTISCISMSGMTPKQIFAKMTPRQRIAQLLVAAVVPNEHTNKAFSTTQNYRMDPTYVMDVAVGKHEVGGILYLGSGLIQERKDLTRELQARAGGTLWFLDDAEWGLQMRSRDGFRYPWNIVEGALPNEYNHLIEQKGYNVAHQLHMVQSHCSLGPVIDVNNNKDNPVIGARSFGADVDRVTQKGIADIYGLQHGGVIAVAKHFPGHGDTNVDSHHGLPVINHSRQHLDAIELKPFKAAIDVGVMGIMTAHIVVPALDDSGVPATVSRKIITDLLRNELGFDGLITTDGMGMEGITNLYEVGQAAVKALQAGVDIILAANVCRGKCNDNWEDPIGRTIDAIEQALNDGRLDINEFNQKVMRVLQLKEWAFNRLKKDHSDEKELLEQAQIIKQEIYTHAITVAQNTLSYPNQADITMEIRGMNKFRAQQFGISHATLEQIKRNHAAGKTQTIILYGSAYAVDLIKDYAECIIVAYEDDPVATQVVEQILKNEIKAEGIMPV